MGWGANLKTEEFSLKSLPFPATSVHTLSPGFPGNRHGQLEWHMNTGSFFTLLAGEQVEDRR